MSMTHTISRSRLRRRAVMTVAMVGLLAGLAMDAGHPATPAAAAPAGAANVTPTPTPAPLPPLVQNRLWVTNGRVRTTQVYSGTVYLGGDFTYVGPATGSGAALSTSTGTPDLSLPRINGQVQVVQPDGAGGWYVGGHFTRVGGAPRNNAAHIRADGGVDPAWNPNPTGVLAGYLIRAQKLWTEPGTQPRDTGFLCAVIGLPLWGGRGASEASG